MAASGAPRVDLDIPERPTQSAQTTLSWLSSAKRPFLYGAAGAAAVLVVVVAGYGIFGGSHTASVPSEAPVIRAEGAPIKVAPEEPGGMEVPNRDLLVYKPMDNETKSGKPPVERLLPEPEQPMVPPSSDTTTETEPEASHQDFARPRDTGASAEEEPEPTAHESILAPTGPSTTAPSPSASVAPPSAPPPRPVTSETARSVPKSSSPASESTQTAALPRPPAPTSKTSSSSGNFRVQLFAGRSESDAEAAWVKLKGKNRDLLASLSSSVAKADLADRGVFYRLRAGPLESEAKAKALCKALGGRGVSCIIIRPDA